MLTAPKGRPKELSDCKHEDMASHLLGSSLVEFRALQCEVHVYTPKKPLYFQMMAHDAVITKNWVDGY